MNLNSVGLINALDLNSYNWAQDRELGFALCVCVLFLFLLDFPICHHQLFATFSVIIGLEEWVATFVIKTYTQSASLLFISMRVIFLERESHACDPNQEGDVYVIGWEFDQKVFVCGQ